MSFNEIEKIDFDILKFEKKHYLNTLLEDERDEFKGMLQDAFYYANTQIESEDFIFEDIENIFKEYFDCCKIKISKYY